LELANTYIRLALLPGRAGIPPRLTLTRWNAEISAKHAAIAAKDSPPRDAAYRSVRPNAPNHSRQLLHWPSLPERALHISHNQADHSLDGCCEYLDGM
jgi:hypothetical protein